MRATVLPVILLTACAAPTTAVVDGHTVPRPTLGYTDHQSYALRDRHAYPRAARPGERLYTYAGEQSGVACGVDVVADSRYLGRSLFVQGFMGPVSSAHTIPMLRWAEDDKYGVRHITGDGAELALTPSSLTGSITHDAFRWNYDLTANGDDLFGVVEAFGLQVPFVIRGRRELWAMPAADQAILLPFLLTCPDVRAKGDDGEPLFGVDFRRQP